MPKTVIKNIFWDVDGVLANLNHAYFFFLKNHPRYAPEYQHLSWSELPQVLPVLPEYGALELKTHPQLGSEMDRDFCADLSYFQNRPLYPGVIETLRELDKLGYRQFTLSATFNVEVKMKFLQEVLAEVTDFLTLECVQHGTFMHDHAKEDHLRNCYQKYGLIAEETLLVDDRIYNQRAAIASGAHPLRLRSEFTTDLPSDLAWIPEQPDLPSVKKWLEDETILSP